MSPEIIVMFILLCFAVALLYRVIVGPEDMDRIVAISTISPITAIILALWGLEMHRGIYLDIALVIALLDFIMVVAYSRYIRGEL
ncbi:monovalent cation/H+ antiporter complex subunit F [Coprothermobacter platensis]|uniref:monovalent cation/H+ antiporter complex subunit F n=1 Tax=Coprothermobacter platensis TaxID=108819 RepID=UPI00036EBD49|nr:monovalent cation/H+ antiporter complex subunit F [Coprothermobacter platensis]